jgi:hypothetical protein
MADDREDSGTDRMCRALDPTYAWSIGTGYNPYPKKKGRKEKKAELLS